MFISLVHAHLLVTLASLIFAHKSPQTPLSTAEEPWTANYGLQIDLPFSGPLSFAHLPYTRCLDDISQPFHIALLGLPFDTGVSYRPGARFGPYAIRAGSRRQRALRGYTLAWRSNPYVQESKIIDCGDVPVSPFDNSLAIGQMEAAYTTLLGRPVPSPKEGKESASVSARLAKDGMEHPRIVTLGGDHTIVLPILRSLYKVYGPISVIHFDAHLDTWAPFGYPGSNSPQAQITHGTFFWAAALEGLMSNTSIHAGIRCKLTGTEDIEHDESVGFELISTDDLDDLGVTDIINRIRTRVGDSPVYLSFDIDVLDPGIAPATGTPEAGGWTMREVKRILRGLVGLNFVGMDLVEVAPSYDHAEITGIAAADLVHDFISLLMADPKVMEGAVIRDALKDEL